MNQTMNTVEDMLAHFVCATETGDSLKMLSDFSIPGRTKSLSVGIDAGAMFKFAPRFPTIAYTAALEESREFAIDSGLLLNSPQDIIGSHAEIALIDGNFVKWSCFRRIYKRPRGIFVTATGCDLYEYHYRRIGRDGSSEYGKRVVAISKSGKPVRVIIEGTRDQNGGPPEGVFLIAGASIIEDASRKGTFKATIKDSVGIILPINQGAHLDVFRLRDGPKTGDRKRPLLHWVASHLKSNQSKTWEVKEHLRGVHDFDIDGMNVKLEGLI